VIQMVEKDSTTVAYLTEMLDGVILCQKVT
jgi:hypothetical protein